MKGVADKPAPSLLVLSPFTTGLDPFEKMDVVNVAAKHLRRRDKQGGAEMTILPLS